MQQWRHNKAMLVPQSATAILTAAGIDVEGMGHWAAEDAFTDTAFEAAPGLLLVPDDALMNALEPFITCVAMHRAYQRFNGNAMVPPATDLSPDRAEGEEAALAVD